MVVDAAIENSSSSLVIEFPKLITIQPVLAFIMMGTFHSNSIKTIITNLSNTQVVWNWLAWLGAYNIKLIQLEK